MRTCRVKSIISTCASCTKLPSNINTIGYQDHLRSIKGSRKLCQNYCKACYKLFFIIRADIRFSSGGPEIDFQTVLGESRILTRGRILGDPVAVPALEGLGCYRNFPLGFPSILKDPVGTVDTPDIWPWLYVHSMHLIELCLSD